MPRQRGGSGNGRISGSSSITIDPLLAHRFASGNRISPLPNPSFKHPVFPAVHTDRDHAGGRGHVRAAAASCGGTAIVDGSMKDGRGLYRHPFLGRIAIGGDLADSLVPRFHAPLARFTSHTRSSSTLRSRTPTSAAHSLQ